MRLILLFLTLAALLQAKGVEDAETYHNNSAMQWHLAMKTIDLIPWIGSERVLDIGCGDGKITALLSAKAAQGSVLGVDVSQAMIDFASTRYSQTDYPNLTFQREDAAELSFENQFDRVVSFSTLHWVIDQEKALKAIHQALAPGGKICLHTYGKGPMNITGIGEILISTEKWASYFPSHTKQRALFSEEEYQALLERAGFQQIQVIGFWNDAPFSSRQALIDFSKPILTFIRHLPQGLQQEFVEEVVDRIISIASPLDGGIIRYRTFNLQALAVK